jgi:hypothetical protein
MMPVKPISPKGGHAAPRKSSGPDEHLPTGSGHGGLVNDTARMGVWAISDVCVIRVAA